VPTNRTPLYRRRRLLTWDEEASLEWGDVTRGKPPAFASDAARRAAWEHTREYFLMSYAYQDGTRPQAWWDYDAPQLGVRHPPDYDYERAALWEARLLSNEEVATLETRWREYFEQAQEPNFWFCLGITKPGSTSATWLKGAAARRAHYRWAGIPHALIRKWSAERRTARQRQGRRIGSVESAPGVGERITSVENKE
jgi:hypothetical protein